ncbi:hypothetical protein AAGS40_00755 [Paraburkholderia sp. PREW-6R]|uniref:hypothetical protein n=1 Tax=Paraburkholderia sp. PREW-6R TaxID=3141544 RepID=UPI0031F54B96
MERAVHRQETIRAYTNNGANAPLDKNKDSQALLRSPASCRVGRIESVVDQRSSRTKAQKTTRMKKHANPKAGVLFTAE